MYRSLVLVIIFSSCFGQLFAQEVKLRESVNRHTVRITEIVLEDDVQIQPDEIAANLNRSIAERKCSAVQSLQISAVDGQKSLVSQSKSRIVSSLPGSDSGFPSDTSKLKDSTYFIGFAVQLSVKSTPKAIKISLNYDHVFLPDGLPNPRLDDLVGVSAKRTIKLKGNTPVAVAVDVKNGVNGTFKESNNRFLIVAVEPND